MRLCGVGWGERGGATNEPRASKLGEGEIEATASASSKVAAAAAAECNTTAREERKLAYLTQSCQA